MTDKRGGMEVQPDGIPIDLSVLIDSQIDCEFSNDIAFYRPTISQLKVINNYNNYCYHDAIGGKHLYCRPRMNHPHACLDGFDVCPLPDGLKVVVYYRNGHNDDWSYNVCEWKHDCHHNGGDVIAFEVLGLADGYCLPWEFTNEHL